MRQTERAPRLCFTRSPNLKLGFRSLENGIGDLHAIGDGEHARYLAFAAVDAQNDAVGHERLLHDAVIEKLPRVLHRDAAGRAFVIFQPEDAQRTRADVEARLALLFIGEVDDVEVETFLLLAADESYRRATLFVTQ